MPAITATKIIIRVTYNGITETMEVEPHEQVTAVLERAENRFHITQNRHLFALFRQDGTEVSEQQSVIDAGLRDGEVLALRPSAVKGGAR